MTENDVLALAILAALAARLTALGLGHIRAQRAAERKAQAQGTKP